MSDLIHRVADHQNALKLLQLMPQLINHTKTSIIKLRIMSSSFKLPEIFV